MGKKLPWYRRYPMDFMTDSDVQAMSWAERGIYNWLLDLQWVEGSIPADMETLSKILHLRKSSLEKLNWLPKLFQLVDGVRINQRLESERSKSIVINKKREIIGREGGKKKAENRSKRLANAYQMSTQPEPEPEPESESEERIRIKKEEEDKKRKERKEKVIFPFLSKKPVKASEEFLVKVSKTVGIWNDTMGQKLKPKTYQETFKKRVGVDPEFFDKMTRAIPIVRDIDDSEWSNSVNLNWLLRPGRNGEIPVVDKVLDGNYSKRQIKGRSHESKKTEQSIRNTQGWLNRKSDIKEIEDEESGPKKICNNDE